MKKSNLYIVIGHILEYFDKSLYAFLAPLFSQYFFPEESKISQLMLIYGILAISNFAKPFGAYYFGKIASNKHPIITLSHSLIGVAICTALIGCIPSYEYIGFFAPGFLMLLRIFQEFFLAGERTIAKIYLIENNKENPYKASSWYQASGIIGSGAASLISAGVFYFNDAFGINLWRLCFILGGITGLVGYILRIHAMKDINTKKIQNHNNYNLKILLKEKLNVVIVAANNILGNCTYYIPFVVLNTIVPILDPNISGANLAFFNTILLILDGVIILGTPYVATKFPIKTFIMLVCGILSVGTIVLFSLIYFIGFSMMIINFIKIFIVMCGSMLAAVEGIYYNSLFSEDKKYKYLAISVGSAIGSCTAGKATTVICLFLFEKTGGVFAIGAYLTVICIINIVLAYFNKLHFRTTTP